MAAPPAPTDLRSALTTVTKTRVSTDVAQQLRKLIEQDTLQVGHKLPSERELVNLLGVSRPVVREALRLMEVMGYLRTDAGRGTFVAARTPPHTSPAAGERLALFADDRLVDELAVVRETIEPRLAALAAEVATEDDVRELRRLQAEADATLEAGDLAAFVRADLALHNGIAQVANNRVFRRMLDDIQDLLLEMRQLTTAELRATRTRKAHLEHRAIVDAIARHDPPAAGRAMLAHFEAQRRAYARLMSRQTAGKRAG
jgi:GntR family transcriptional repressor for pyruvate dehydrogenase complex